MIELAIELTTVSPGYDPAWALAGLVVVVGLGVLLGIGWAIEFLRKHSVYVVVFIIVVILFLLLRFGGLK